MRLQFSFIMLSSLPLNVGSFEALFQRAVDRHRMVGEDLVAVKPGGEAAAGGDGQDRKSTRLNSSHRSQSRMPSSA